MKFFIKYNYNFENLQKLFSEVFTQNKFLQIDFFNSSLLQYNSLNLNFVKQNYILVHKNLKNLYNVIYYSFLSQHPVYIYTKRILFNEVKSTNFFFSQFFKKKKMFIVIAVDNYLSRQDCYNIQHLNYFFIKPITRYQDYVFTTYPCILDLNTEVKSYIFIQIIKYIAFKAINQKNVLSLKNYFFFLTFFKTYKLY